MRRHRLGRGLGYVCLLGGAAAALGCAAGGKSGPSFDDSSGMGNNGGSYGTGDGGAGAGRGDAGHGNGGGGGSGDDGAGLGGGGPDMPGCGGSMNGPTLNTTPPPYAPMGTLSVPSGHPRIWFDAQRIARAKQWAQSTGWKPRSTSSPQPADRLDQALTCIVGNGGADAQAAVDYLASLTLNTSSPGDDARWYGEAALL